MQSVVNARCVACHAASPTQPGFVEAPAGLLLETIEHINSNADRVATTVQSRYMPIGNLTGMTDDASWYAQRGK